MPHTEMHPHTPKPECTDFSMWTKWRTKLATPLKPGQTRKRKTLASVILQGFCGGDSWTRTNDPIDVNDVLYRLSHATLSEHSGLYLADRSVIC